MELDRIDLSILWILRSAQTAGLSDLSKMQVNKLTYLLDTESREFMGKSFFSEITFVRENRGPISFNVYDSLDKLVNLGLINLEISDGPGFTAPRHGYSLKDGTNVESLNSFSEGELYFLASVIDDYIHLSQKELTDAAYNTDPMKSIVLEEKGSIDKGRVIDMNTIRVNPEIMEMQYAGD